MGVGLPVGVITGTIKDVVRPSGTVGVGKAEDAAAGPSDGSST